MPTTPFVTSDVSPYERPSLADIALRYRDQEVAFHGSAEAPESVWPGRRVVDIDGRTWPAPRPEECTHTEFRGQWLTATGQVDDPHLDIDTAIVLVCPNCGLDCT
jgi:hypothetical protein